MKILELPTYVTIKELPEFIRRKSGYGYMTWDISKSIAKKGCQVDLLTKFNFNKGQLYCDVNFLKLTWLEIFKYSTLSLIFKALQIIYVDKLRFKKALYVIYYYISCGYLERVIKDNKYDIVHIHGVGYFNKPIIDICEKYNLKYVTTLHGLNSFSDSKKIPNKEAGIEKEFLKNSEQNGNVVTVVSSGVRNSILSYLKISNSNNFKVITNGSDINYYDASEALNIRDKYSINPEQKIMLCVGRIDKNKNQEQIIRSYKLLDSQIKKDFVILFVGADGTEGKFLKKLDEEELGNVKFCGYVKKDDLQDYYKQSDYNIMVSIKEGFGLPIVEGFVYGLPCVTFSDLDAVDDLYNNKTMLTIQERSDSSLALGISKMFHTTWDNEFIRNYSNQFSLEIMADKYINLFENVLENDIKNDKYS
ncbi:glycosyltransferase family 4 protein [Gillisia limnaea]|uniref:Glycosyl transferase group 1 n=1 Tax=Gillisia limnaea (strain DSM 15749 / LMG 21470 / R-8282) TaxID=865937 RepID=H2BRT1_GILLR|nr:glycosyltransferase family 4 protein [Gillisia limnaea]EHQ01396.1 glycosyl transferase group 1 [Gillisia limnaea DSM 15749]